MRRQPEKLRVILRVTKRFRFRKKQGPVILNFMLLTDVQIRNARPLEKAFRLVDGEGLALVVRPSGAKHWQLRYYFVGKEKTLSLGKYPRISLGEARAKKQEALALLGEGRDPSAARKKQRLLAAYQEANSFEAMAKEWHKWKLSSWTENHGERVWQRLSNHAFPVIGTRPIADLEPLELLAMVRRIEAKGKTHMARRVLQLCGAVFRYAIVTGRAKTNIADGLVIALQPHQECHYPALREEELQEYFEKVAALETHPQNRNALELLLLTALRTGELRFAKWEQVDWEGRSWRIPEENAKMKREHLVPLSKQAFAVLKRQWKISGRSSWIFPNLQRRKHPVMSEGTILSLIDRMGLKGRLVGHGFRAMFSTILNEHGFNRDAIERQLAHVESNRVRSAYNRAEYLEERKRIMQWWADFLDDQNPEKTKSQIVADRGVQELSQKFHHQPKVVPFRKGSR